MRMRTDRRVFLAGLPALAIAPVLAARKRRAMTVRGPVDVVELSARIEDLERVVRQLAAVVAAPVPEA